jgi:urease accessory protein
VGGDRLSLKVHLSPQAQALVTTAAAAKVYRSNGQTAYQDTQLTLAEGACLEWLPQDTIVFDGALYQQHLRIDLAPGAVWLGWDVTRLGRSARGEKFLSGRWRSAIEVWQGDRLLWLDPQQVAGGSESLDSLHGLAGCPVVGSFAFIGQIVSPELVEQARLLWTGSREQIGVTRLMSGLLCRYRGHSSTAARHWFIQVWHLIRQDCLGRSTCVPRVWQL